MPPLQVSSCPLDFWKVFNKNRAIRTATDLQCNALTFHSSLCRITAQNEFGKYMHKSIELEVHDLFRSFCRSPNNPVFVLKFLITCLHSFISYIHNLLILFYLIHTTTFRCGMKCVISSDNCYMF